jgi:hypothetical protein
MWPVWATWASSGDVAGLGDVGEQRVVAEMFPMMRIETAERPLDLGAGADDGPIHVDRQPRQAPGAEGFDDEIVIEFAQRRERRLRELLEPVAHRPAARQARQAAEPRDQGIADEIRQMLQAARADVEQAHHQQRQARAAVVTRERGERGPQPNDQLQFPDVAADEFKPAVRREVLGNELDRQITLDRLAQSPYLQAHQRGLLDSMDDVGTSLHSMRGQAPLMHFGASLRASRISDQG